MPALGRRPPGILLEGVAGYGVGLRDGDVLTEVAGQPVTSPGAVVGIVLQARGARASVITGVIWRGQASFPVAVEQPYGPGPR